MLLTKLRRTKLVLSSN